MANIGRNIEIAIQSMLKVSEEVADIQALLEAANNDLSMLETLFSVSKYIGLNPEQHIIMPVLEDSIKGVFGATYCQVIFDKNKTHLSNSKELYSHLDYNVLKNNVSDILVVNDVCESEITNLTEGSLIIIRLSVGDELYGFLACYWTMNHNLSSSSLLFLQIVSNQVSMFLKSNALIEEFKNLAVNDPLTGIYNRSYFLNIEENVIPVIGESIIIFDIDYFKKVNDSMGHQYGDKVLIEFSKILTKCSEEVGGVPFRYGGEEFIVKCEGGDDVAIALAENIRNTFYYQTGYTVSGGMCTLGTSCRVPSYEKLLNQADSALYVSKQSGRNRITKATGDIQVLKESSVALTQLLSKAYRKLNTSTIFRLKARGNFVISEEEFVELQAAVTNMGRLYDAVFLTDSLDIMVILDGQVDVTMFMERAKKKLSKKFIDINYDVYPLQAVFNEVIVHSSRVSELAQILAVRMGYDHHSTDKIRLACEWHDLGKLCIDPAVYSKKGRLTEDEYEIIKMHTWLSYLIADKNPTLTEFADWVLYHHEDFNGKGYYKLVGDEIPFEAQIISIVDKFDALTENRCYRKAYEWTEALEILESEKVKFDSKLFNEFSDMVNQLMKQK